MTADLVAEGNDGACTEAVTFLAVNGNAVVVKLNRTMGDPMNVTLHVGDMQVVHEKATITGYTVEANLTNLLTKYKDDSALVGDTLAYGKVASAYKKHDTMAEDYTVSDSTILDATVTPNGAFTDYTVVFGQVNFIKISVTLAERS